MKYKLISGIVLLVIILILIFQNTASIDIQLFFWTVSISRVLLMAVFFLMGAVVGWIANGYYRFLKARKKTNQI